MNLAEIRKKAHSETKSDSGVVRDNTSSPMAAAEIIDEQSVLSQVIPSSDIDNENTYEKELQRGLSDTLFDPLSAIVAGRVAAEDQNILSDKPGESVVENGFLADFLCFRVSNEIYVIDIMDLKEIIKPRELTEVPRVPTFVSGILSLRGTIIPIFNMRKRLGLPELQQNLKERILVVKKGEELCGLLVDEVIQVIKLRTDTIEEAPSVLDGIAREFVDGIGRCNDNMLILLNLQNILNVDLV
jgi:purine-binding chemotaxis protein CheW